MNKTAISSAHFYCSELVKENDPDRYMLSMLVRGKRREALWALFAFNYEIAKTRDVVSDTKLGLIRLQWWRDRIGEIYEGGAPPEHEVLKPLAVAIAEYDLPREAFDNLIYAREFDLEDVCPSNLEGLLKYCEFTAAPLFALTIKIAGENEEQGTLTQVAVNYALAGLLRAVPHFAAKRRCMLPEDVLRSYGQSVNKLYDYKRVDNFSDILSEVGAAFDARVKPRSRLLKGAQALSCIYMKQLKKSGYDPYAVKMRMEPALKHLRVLLSLA
ncbi:MAG: squalene/phytoene synthase family protein [Micavibrio sp.]|nr:squalene/phytoene synthase family protein [Micavibrio sp.]